MPGGILGGAASGASAGMVAGPYGAIIGAVVGGVLGGLSYHPPKPPQLSKVSLDPATTGQKDFLDQSEHLGDVGHLLNQANDFSNDAFKERIDKFAPETERNVGQIGATGLALSSGGLPSGFLEAGANGRHLDAADLGLTSDDLVKLGSNVTGQGENQAQALNPFNATSTGTLISPGALLARRDSQNYYNTALKNQAAIGKSVGDAINPFASGVATGLGAFQSSLRGLTNTGAAGATNSGTPGTSQFGDDFYQQYGAEGDVGGFTGAGESLGGGFG